MSKNSFKELQEMQEAEYEDNVKNVKNSLDGNMKSISSLTNIIDLYFSKVLSYFLSMGGGKPYEDSDPKDQ